MENRLAIVMPVWNNWNFTKKALKMLAPLPDTILFVVDNGSTDGTKDMVSDTKVVVIHNDQNLGFARGCNTGYAQAKQMGFQNVMFLNNDIKVVSDFETWTLPILEKTKLGAIVGPTVGCLDESLNFVCEASKWPSKGFGYLSGWNITASVETWEKLVLEGETGPWSTNFFAYFEDTDLSFRAMKAGLKFEIVGVPVRHFGRATSKKLGLLTIYTQSKKTFLGLWKGRTEEFRLKRD